MALEIILEDKHQVHFVVLIVLIPPVPRMHPHA